MAKNMNTILTRSTAIISRLLAISIITCWPLVALQLTRTKWKSLILIQTLGQIKRLIHIAHHRELEYFTLYLVSKCIVLWSTLFIFSIFSIHRYGVISRDSSVLIIGGLCNGATFTTIAKYTLDKWEHVGNLQKGRCGHRAISNGDRIYVAGGHGTKRFVTDTFLSLPFDW